MVLTERQKDMIYSLSVVVGGGLIIYAATEVVLPAFASIHLGLNSLWIQVAVLALLVALMVAWLVYKYRDRVEWKGVWALTSGSVKYELLRMKRGEVLAGTAHEEDGRDFDLVIMNEGQGAAFARGDRSVGSVRRYEGKGRYRVRWTAPEAGIYYMAGDIYRRHAPRKVAYDLRIERGEKKERFLTEEETRVFKAVKRVRAGTITEISAKCGYSRGTTSKYLERLKNKGLLRTRREGRYTLWEMK